jgi:hypothetical protein
MPAPDTRNALCGSLLIASAFASVARAEVPPDAAAVMPFPVGAHAPDFTVHRADGTPYVFNSRHLAVPHSSFFTAAAGAPTAMRSLRIFAWSSRSYAPAVS